MRTDMAHDRRDPDSTHAALINAAIEAVQREGHDGVRVAEIAAHAGVTTGAVYAHFVDRSGLISAAEVESSRRVAQEMLSGFGALLVSEGSASGEQISGYSSRVFAVEGRTMRRRWAEALLRASHHADMAPYVEDSVGGVVQSLTDAIALAQTDGRIAADLDPRAVAMMTIGATIGASILDVAVRVDDDLADALGVCWTRVIGNAFTPQSATADSSTELPQH